MRRLVTSTLLTGWVGFDSFPAETKSLRKSAYPSCSFRASIFGGRRGDGEAFAPMMVVRGGDFKMKSEVTATSTFLVDGAAQEAVWSHNEKSSFDETHVIKYMEEIIAAGTPDLSLENPLIWMVDGVRTHATPAVVRRAHELGIILFLMPPNCTNILQGEDLVNFGIFNNDYNQKKLHHVSLIKAGHASVVETLSTLLA